MEYLFTLSMYVCITQEHIMIYLAVFASFYYSTSSVFPAYKTASNSLLYLHNPAEHLSNKRHLLNKVSSFTKKGGRGNRLVYTYMIETG